MMHISIPPNGHSPWNKWLIYGMLAGFILVELAACAWIIYKIISPKY